MKRIPTPLAVYLSQQNLTQTQFARDLAQRRGFRSWQSHVSRWATGISFPSRNSQLEIAMVTNGRVLPVDWIKWRDNNQHHENNGQPILTNTDMSTNTGHEMEIECHG